MLKSKIRFECFFWKFKIQNAQKGSQNTHYVFQRPIILMKIVQKESENTL